MTTEPLKPRVIEGEGRARAVAHHAAGADVGAHRPGGGDAAAAAGGAGAEGAQEPRGLVRARRDRRRRCRLVRRRFHWWIAAAFERSAALGTLAATAVVAGVAGAGAIIAREVTSLWRLRNVESIRERFNADIVSPQARAARSPTSLRWCRANARPRPRSKCSSARSSRITTSRSRSRSCRAP